MRAAIRQPARAGSGPCVRERPARAALQRTFAARSSASGWKVSRQRTPPRASVLNVEFSSAQGSAKKKKGEHSEGSRPLPVTRAPARLAGTVQNSAANAAQPDQESALPGRGQPASDPCSVLATPTASPTKGASQKSSAPRLKTSALAT